MTATPTSRSAHGGCRMSQQPVLVVMGVSGSGKTTVGAALAQRLRRAVRRRRRPPPAGEHRQDDRRRGRSTTTTAYPWLEAIGAWLAAHADGGVMSCSALKRKYRDQLRHHVPGRGVRAPGRQPRGDRTPSGHPPGPLHAGLPARPRSSRTLEPLAARRARRRDRRRPERSTRSSSDYVDQHSTPRTPRRPRSTDVPPVRRPAPSRRPTWSQPVAAGCSWCWPRWSAIARDRRTDHRR